MEHSWRLTQSDQLQQDSTPSGTLQQSAPQAQAHHPVQPFCQGQKLPIELDSVLLRPKIGSEQTSHQVIGYS